MTHAKKDQIRALLKSIETGDPGPIAVVNEEKYIQHNPQTHEGSEGLAALFQRLSKTSPRVNIVRAFEDGDFVFAHTEYDFASRKIGFEVFRFEGGRAVEHWDDIQERQGPNRAGRSMVDGPTEAADHDLKENNRAFVRSFVETVLVDGQLNRLTDFVDADAFAEHNPRGADGVAALRSALAASDDGRRQVAYRRLHRVPAEGNFVLSVSEGDFGGVHSAFYDLFRVAGGKVVEHWDTTEKIAPPGASGRTTTASSEARARGLLVSTRPPRGHDAYRLSNEPNLRPVHAKPVLLSRRAGLTGEPTGGLTGGKDTL